MTKRELQAREKESKKRDGERQKCRSRGHRLATNDGPNGQKYPPAVLSTSCTDMMSPPGALRSRPRGRKVPSGIDLRSA